MITTLAVDDVLGRLETQVRPGAEARGLTLQVQRCGGFVASDEALLDRVLRNLAQNAVRYTPAGRVARAVARRGFVRVLVSDTGVGIAAGERKRIFDAYYQVDNPARDRRRGLGLGLAVVRDLGATLGLRIRLRSLPGKGSTFAVEIPEAPAPPASAAAAESGAVDLVRGAFVVVIDDDDAGRDGLSTTLRDMGCRVLEGTSADEILERLAEAEFAPQLLVSDYRLGNGATGVEAIARGVAVEAVDVKVDAKRGLVAQARTPGSALPLRAALGRYTFAVEFTEA